MLLFFFYVKQEFVNQIRKKKEKGERPGENIFWNGKTRF